MQKSEILGRLHDRRCIIYTGRKRNHHHGIKLYIEISKEILTF